MNRLAAARSRTAGREARPRLGLPERGHPPGPRLRSGSAATPPGFPPRREGLRHPPPAGGSSAARLLAGVRGLPPSPAAGGSLAPSRGPTSPPGRPVASRFIFGSAEPGSPEGAAAAPGGSCPRPGPPRPLPLARRRPRPAGSAPAERGCPHPGEAAGEDAAAGGAAGPRGAGVQPRLARCCRFLLAERGGAGSPGAAPSLPSPGREASGTNTPRGGWQVAGGAAAGRGGGWGHSRAGPRADFSPMSGNTRALPAAHRGKGRTPGRGQRAGRAQGGSAQSGSGSLPPAVPQGRNLALPPLVPPRSSFSTGNRGGSP